MTNWKWKVIQTWIKIVCVCLFLHPTFTLDVNPQKEVYVPDYRVYHNISSLGLKVDSFVRDYPSLIKHLPKFVSKLGRQQYVLRLTNFTRLEQEKDQSAREDTTKILLSFGEHAREFLPVESLLLLLERITAQAYNNENTQIVDLNKADIYIIVMSNPDGREYIEDKKNYCWRGTSTGVDLNRNFDWEFGGKGSSADVKDEEYRGPHAFSEPETLVYKMLTESVHFDAFVSFHSGIHQIYIPFADTKSREIKREPEKVDAMIKLAHLLSTATRFNYQFGKAAVLNKYTADGTVFDYMAGVHHIPFSYAIELWGPKMHKGSSCFDLFNPANDNLKSVTEDLLPLYKTLFHQLIQWKHSKGAILQTEKQTSIVEPYDSEYSSSYGRLEEKNDVPSMAPGYILMVLVVIVTVLVGLHGKYPVCRRMYQRRRVVSLRSLSSSFSTSIFST